MNLEWQGAFDSLADGTKEVAEVAYEKTNEFHEQYISKITPELGKYGDAAKFAAEMVPGVSEYNAIREGDWQAFAIAAGIDVAAIAIGAATVGTGYAAAKGWSAAAKAGVKTATKEIAEAGAEKLVKEATEAGTEKFLKEAIHTSYKEMMEKLAETGAETAAKELAETGAEAAAKELAETGTEAAAKELAETGAEVAAKELAETGAEAAAKELAETGAETATKEVAEDTAEKAGVKVTEQVQIVQNKRDGVAREEKVLQDLVKECEENGTKVIREAYLRYADGSIIKDIQTGTARRIDLIVSDGKKVLESIEVTSETADKAAQTAKELRILQDAWEHGGAFVKDIDTGTLIEFGKDIVTEIRRVA